MLGELQDLQETGEDVWEIEMSFDIETRTEEDGEILQRQYTFCYSEHWDKWTFQEFKEERTNKTERISDRKWRESTHVSWDDINESRHISVPPSVADALAKATGSESVTIQIPRGSNEYETVYSTNPDDR